MAANALFAAVLTANITGVRSFAGILCGNEGLHVSLPSLHLADSTVFLYNVNNTDYILKYYAERKLLCQVKERNWMEKAGFPL